MSEQLDTRSDEELVKLAQAGKQEAFSVLYERYLSPIYNRLRALLPPEAVEDVTQEVFIAAVQGLDSYRGQSLFRTWLGAIARHKAMDYYRRRGRQPTTVPLDAEQDRPAETDLQQDDRELVRLALRRLPAHYQEIILLRFAEGMPFDQIARTLGLSLEAAKSRFRRAIAAIAQEMQTDRPHE